MPATLPLPLLCLWRGSVLGNGWRGPGKALWGCWIVVQPLARPGLMAWPGVGRASYSAGMCSITAPECGGSRSWGPGLGGFLRVAWMPGMSPQGGDQPVYPQIRVSAQTDQHQPYAETSTVHTPRALRQREPRPLHPTPGLMEGQGLHPHPTAHRDCSWDGPITTAHLPPAGWALAT